jgi:hypothetical protein
MNERIKTMWEESTGSVWPCPGKFTAGEYDHNLKKFAELIVRECASELTREGFTYKSSDHDADYMQGMLDSADIIKKHFGLKNEI